MKNMPSRKRLFNLVSTLSALLLTACAAVSIRVSPVPIESQTVTYSAGEALVVSRKTVTVSVAPAKAIPSREKIAKLLLLFANTSPSDILVSPEDIRASFQGKALKIYSYEELAAKQESGQTMQRIGLALQAAGAGMQGGQQTQYVSGSVVTPQSGVATYSGTVTYSDPAVAAQSQANVNREIARFESERRRSSDLLASWTLRKNTVPSGKSYLGEISVLLPDGVIQGEMKISVLINGETHHFKVLFQG